MTSSIDVVIPVHNRFDLTASCLGHLSAQTQPHTVVVCDNGSTDGTPLRVRGISPDVRLIELGANLGFSAACNRGVASGNGEVVVLLNNDVECPPDFLAHLVAPFEDEAIGSVAALLVTPRAERIESFGVAVDRTLAGYPRLRGMPSSEAQTDRPILLGPTGAAGAYRRAAWQEVGGLDEGVFAYGEDVDLALRLQTAGWHVAGAGDAVAVHIGSASAVSRSPWQRYQGGFSRAYFMRRYAVLRSRAALRALATEVLAGGGDALLYSRDLAALRGRLAGWHAARDLPRRPRPSNDAVDNSISFAESVRLRRRVYSSATRPS